MDEPIKKKVLTEPDDGGHSMEIVSPLLSPQDGKRISDRNASFANELRERESDALRLAGLSTPRRLLEIDERKSAIELRALRDEARRKHDLDVPLTIARVEEINTHDMAECKKENTANRALIANKNARIELLQ